VAKLRPAQVTLLVRDRLTWLAYLSLSSYAFCLYALGPILAFLRQELHLSYTLASWHSSLWAVGAILSGVSFDFLTQKFGRRTVFWLSAAALDVGILLFVAGHVVGVTLLAAAVAGTGGTLLGSGSSTALADRHGSASDRALVEANVGASVTAVAVPALLGLLATTRAGWRPGLLVPGLSLLLLYAVAGRVPFPAPSREVTAGRLPGAFWWRCGLVALAVAVEFCIVFYGVPLLASGAGFSTAGAAATMSLFFAGELAARVAGAGLTRHPGRAQRIIAVALGLAFAGFIMVWVTRTPALAAVALFVTGLGVGNLYPLSIALALEAGGGRTDQAMARTQVFVGFAVLVAPLFLGVLSDHFGVLRALAVEPVLIGAAALLLVAAPPPRGRPRGVPLS
jgi:MFS family permease